MLTITAGAHKGDLVFEKGRIAGVLCGAATNAKALGRMIGAKAWHLQRPEDLQAGSMRRLPSHERNARWIENRTQPRDPPVEQETVARGDAATQGRPGYGMTDPRNLPYR